jgi:hypothetical protein
MKDLKDVLQEGDQKTEQTSASSESPTKADLMTVIEKLTAAVETQTAIAERAGRKDLEAEIRLNTKREHYRNTQDDPKETVKKLQANCDHLKGGRLKNRLAANDFNVFLHRYPDNSVRIKCLSCRMVWFPSDTVETIFRGGKSHPNHTGIDWAGAVKMVKQSTNKSSSSEIAPEFMSRVPKMEDIPDDLAVLRHA